MNERMNDIIIPSLNKDVCEGSYSSKSSPVSLIQLALPLPRMNRTVFYFHMSRFRNWQPGVNYERMKTHELNWHGSNQYNNYWYLMVLGLFSSLSAGVQDPVEGMQTLNVIDSH